MTTGVVCLVILSNKIRIGKFLKPSVTVSMGGSIMRELILVMVKALVDKPDEVEIREVEGDVAVIFELKSC